MPGEHVEQFVLPALVLLLLFAQPLLRLIKRWRLWLRPKLMRRKSYRVWSTAFDQIVDAAELPDSLGKISLDQEKGYLTGSDNDWLESQRQAAGIYESLADRRPVNSFQTEKTDGLTAAILVDQSGSMKGPRMAFTAAIARYLVEGFASSGVSSELLGFSTAGWKGGFSRQNWLANRRPAYPGRLCDLLHIVYKSAQDSELSVGNWSKMLHPDLLRENVVGEAIEWACGRLRARPELRKTLIILSDGAPVDDSTLSENHASVLLDHLLSVLADIETHGDVTIKAIGIDEDVKRAYQDVTMANQDDEIATTAAKLDNLVREICAAGS